ncbi:conserved hypothetical protein [Culex quinquefasciatus]|uniref:C2H2-type domain-containing protein n=1 Tax=Culex quinquefasciatus TaxID=7176 RepID=B0WXA1_CULQU|nr:conserved hypothetical protein [Culex quinquefasciatus]|eukprot:XP_001862023.1 conserved hypothetical protein [Culex quinquefasciatus]
MNIDLDAILDTPVQTSLFVDCFDDLMDSLSSDFPLNGEFDSLLADLHQSSTVLTPEPSPEENVILGKDHVNEFESQRTAAVEVKQTNFLSSTTSLEQFDAMMYLSGTSPPSEQHQPYESLNHNLPPIYPPDIVDTGSIKQEETTQSESSEPQEHDHQNGVAQQTLVVQSAGQQFEIGISIVVPSEQLGEYTIQDVSTQQALTTQEPALTIETIPQVQCTRAALPTGKILPTPKHDECKGISMSIEKSPVGTNYHDNYQKWLSRPPIRMRQNQDTKLLIDQMIVEEQPTTSNVESVRNFVHIPSSYVINTDGTSKTFVVHEVYKVADSKKRKANTQESLHELSQPNRKRPRKSNVIYNTDFLCVPCQKTFGKKGSLKQHIRSYHSEPLPFHCDVCGKNFATEESLVRHVVNHDQRNKKFQCSECDKRYVHSKDRDRHFQTHHGVPAHTCGQCGMAFARRDHLLAHEMTHERRQSREVLLVGSRKVQGSV